MGYDELHAINISARHLAVTLDAGRSRMTAGAQVTSGGDILDDPASITRSAIAFHGLRAGICSELKFTRSSVVRSAPAGERDLRVLEKFQPRSPEALLRVLAAGCCVADRIELL